MKVTVIAKTEFTPDYYNECEALEFDTNLMAPVAESLTEFAGRNCYQSWNKPNPATAGTSDYIGNILKQKHYSVLEHASVTFLLRDVSRSFLAEITRHRHLSFSVESQRYVDYTHTKPVYPPNASTEQKEQLDEWYNTLVGAYEYHYTGYINNGFTRKQAREAARAILPNAAPVAMVVTGNLRAWMEFLEKRDNPHADAEMQEVAKEIRKKLIEIAPTIFET